MPTKDTGKSQVKEPKLWGVSKSEVIKFKEKCDEYKWLIASKNADRPAREKRKFKW